MSNTEQYLTGQMRPGHAALLEAFARDSEAAITALRPALDLPYGPHPRQRFDLFRGTGARRGALTWFHAGYWQSRDKAQFRFLAPALVAAGIDVALVNYPLCPDVTLAALVEATRDAVPGVLAATGARDLVAAGHSAGGHIAAELALTDWAARGLAHPPVAGIAALSGVYELAPLLDTPLNDKLRLDSGSAAALSPLRRARGNLPPALFAVGGAETAAFREQNARMHQAWAEAGNRSEALVVPGADHFSLLRELAPPHALLERVLALFGG